MASFLQVRQFAIFAVIAQIAFIVLFYFFADYSHNAMPKDAEIVQKQGKHSEDSGHHKRESHTPSNDTNSQTAGAAKLALDHYYPMFQDVHVMIFVGFGYLMTFLKRYGYSSVGINFILAAFVIQWSMLVQGFFRMENGKFTIGIQQMLTADFAAAAVLISMGALLGKLAPIQYLIVGLFEVVFQVVGEHIVFHELQANDVGGSMVVHVFGAYFGLAVSRVIIKKKMMEHEHESFVYHSDLFAMIGTLFLWIFWPSFNSAVAEPADARHRAVLNTYLCLTSCCIVSFVITSIGHSAGKFNMDHVLNGSLAGGVAIGTTANLILHPFGALSIGVGAAVLSVVGFKHVDHVLSHNLRMHDTCGVHNLHGMPGILAGIIGVIATLFVSSQEYGQNELEIIFPAMSHGRTAFQQAMYQLASICVCFAFAIVGGVITGFILRLPGLNKLDETNYYSDQDFWVMPDDFEFVTDSVLQRKISSGFPLSSMAGIGDTSCEPRNIPVYNGPPRQPVFN